jgi:hypothetical protein
MDLRLLPMAQYGSTIMSGALSFDLSIEPRPRMVSVVRRFVEETLERVVADPDAVFRIGMTAHELLENAAKYAVGDRAQLAVRLQDDGVDARAYLSLSNETTGLHVDRLRERVAELADSKNPFGLYTALMRRNPTDASESGLGLARICAEGEMSLGLEVHGNMVTIMASARIPRRPK